MSTVRHFLSIGAGNCDAEIRLATELRKSGASDFVIDCLDLNERMLERGKAAAAASDLAVHIEPICADFNSWQPSLKYKAVLVNHALHHVLRMEALLDEIRDSLQPGGSLILSEMIGLNGHRRWPEALGPLIRFWDELPESYRYNHRLQRQDTEYPDWDCATGGFEGIRCQDIVPLLLERFHFRFFYAFGNVVAPFVDRCYGPNFDARSEWDRVFIDRVHAFDEVEIMAGRIKPTIMLAVLGVEEPEKLVCLKPRTPEFCVRWP